MPAAAQPKATACASPSRSPRNTTATALAASGIAIVNTPLWLAGTWRRPLSHSQVENMLAASA